MKKIIYLVIVFWFFSEELCFAQFDHTGSGRAIAFDGINDIIDFGDIYDDVHLPVSVSAWIWVDPGKLSQSPIFVSQDNFSLYNGFWFIINPTHLFAGYGDGLGYNNPAFRREKSGYHSNIYGKWAHVCMVMKGATDVDLYVNGINIGGVYSGYTDMPMSSDYSDEVAKAGQWITNDVSHYFKGRIDDLRIWNIALTENQIRADMCRKLSGSENGLIGYWDFDETEGVIVYDKSMYQNHGVLHGTTRVFSGAPIGDLSEFQYNGGFNSYAAIGLDIKNITGSPEGIHVYKVLNTPSQVEGLSIDDVPTSYYGVFIINNFGPSIFEINNCQIFSRLDNSIANWQSQEQQVLTNRAEVIFIPSESFPVSLGEDQVLCNEVKFTIRPDISYEDKVFLWNTGEQTPEITVRQSGNYSVTIRDGCIQGQDSIVVRFETQDWNFDLGENVKVCEGETVTIKASVDPHGKTFLWSSGQSTQEILVTESGKYTLHIKNLCYTTVDSVEIFFIAPLKKENTPNVITPNNDKLNDYFVIDHNDSPVWVKIFNRWGVLVYEDKDYENNWNAEDLNSGVYFFSASNGCGKQIKGSIHVISD